MELYPDILSSRVSQSSPEVIRQNWPYSSPANLAYGHLERVLIWCQASCRDDWRWLLRDSATDNQGWSYQFYFKDGRDALAFQLRWSTA